MPNSCCSTDNCILDIYEENKCIFHCQKTVENGWIVESDDKDIKWNDKVKVFWNKFEENGHKLPAKSIVPYCYDNNDKRIDFNNVKKVIFNECIFVEDFFLRFEDININTFQNISFLGCTLNNVTLKNINTKKLIFNDNRLKSLDITNIIVTSLYLTKLIIENKLNISKIKSENTHIKITNVTANILYLKESNINKLTLVNSIIKDKLKIVSLNSITFNCQNVDFLEKSKILLQRVTANDFRFTRISQESKYIQFNDVKIKEKLNFFKVEFHNTYFNSCNFSSSNKKLAKLTFASASLNSVQWGNKNKINASREIFRDLKNSYDNIQNFIEANNFFAMEMKAYKEELKQKKSKSHWQEKIIFYLNEKVSNFSQSWFLPFLWILLLNYFFYIVQSIVQSDTKTYHISLMLSISIIFWIIGRFIYERFKLYLSQHILVIIAFTIVVYILNYGIFTDVLQFSHLQSWKDYRENYNDSIFILWAMHKMLLGFLIYHFIIALRRQTRR